MKFHAKSIFFLASTCVRVGSQVNGKLVPLLVDYGFEWEYHADPCIRLRSGFLRLKLRVIELLVPISLIKSNGISC